MEQLDMEQFRTIIKQDYVKLLELLAQVINADKGFSVSDISDGERFLDAHDLTRKFFEHTLTVLYLSRGTNQDLPSLKFSFVDYASIDTLTRVAVEAFLVFHYVFLAPSTADEKEYRYLAYRAAGITERQNVPVSTEEHRQKLAMEKEELYKLHDKLKSNTVFQNLKPKQKELILKGRWKLPSWREIAIDAGLSEMLAKHVYGSLAGYAHSSFLSVRQMSQVLESKEEEQLIKTSIITMNIVTANIIQGYCRLFPRVKTVLSKDLEGSDIMDRWIQVDRGFDELTNKCQENG
jgi:hypothetical protein